MDPKANMNNDTEINRIQKYAKSLLLQHLPDRILDYKALDVQIPRIFQKRVMETSLKKNTCVLPKVAKASKNVVPKSKPGPQGLSAMSLSVCGGG